MADGPSQDSDERGSYARLPIEPCVRAVGGEEVWPSPPTKPKIAPDTGSAIAFSKFTVSGVLPFPEVLGPIFDEVNEKYGTDVQPLFK